jgi:hypothetical protein
MFCSGVGGDPVTFADVSEQVQFDDTARGSVLLAWDYDRGGDLDLLQTCVLGGQSSGPAIPAASPAGMTALAILLAGAGWTIARRRARRSPA